jgi:hypothetical protein
MEGRGPVEQANLETLELDLDMIMELENWFEEDDVNEDLPRIEEQKKEYLS